MRKRLGSFGVAGAALLALSACASAPPPFCSTAKPIIAKAGAISSPDAVIDVLAAIMDGCQGEAGCGPVVSEINKIIGDTPETLAQIEKYNAEVERCRR